MSKIPEPNNVQEQYLHAAVLRLDALCNMLSSLIEHIAEKEGVATTENKRVEKPRTSRKKKVSE